jgi:hypothetical protein
MFFFKKIIFDINLSKQSENKKKLAKKISKFKGTPMQICS